MQDFDVLSEFGKYCKSESFKQELSEFFWRIIADSDQYNAELLQNCITKFADMVKYWTLEQKQPFLCCVLECEHDKVKAPHWVI